QNGNRQDGCAWNGGLHCQHGESVLCGEDRPSDRPRLRLERRHAEERRLPLAKGSTRNERPERDGESPHVRCPGFRQADLGTLDSQQLEGHARAYLDPNERRTRTLEEVEISARHETSQVDR